MVNKVKAMSSMSMTVFTSLNKPKMVHFVTLQKTNKGAKWESQKLI